MGLASGALSPGHAKVLLSVEPPEFQKYLYTEILERPNHLEPGAVADMGQSRIAMTAEVPLADQPVLRAIEDRTPALELANAIEVGEPVSRRERQRLQDRFQRDL